MEIIAAALFALALIHTFSTTFFEHLAHQTTHHAGRLHLLGEVEVVSGFRAALLVAVMAAVDGGAEAVA